MYFPPTMYEGAVEYNPGAPSHAFGPDGDFQLGVGNTGNDLNSHPATHGLEPVVRGGLSRPTLTPARVGMDGVPATHSSRRRAGDRRDSGGGRQHQLSHRHDAHQLAGARSVADLAPQPSTGQSSVSCSRQQQQQQQRQQQQAAAHIQHAQNLPAAGENWRGAQIWTRPPSPPGNRGGDDYVGHGRQQQRDSDPTQSGDANHGGDSPLRPLSSHYQQQQSRTQQQHRDDAPRLQHGRQHYHQPEQLAPAYRRVGIVAGPLGVRNL